MHRSLLFFSLTSWVFILLFEGCQPARDSLTQLEQDIRARLDTVPGTFAVAFQEVDSPSHVLLIHEREDFHAASTMKTPVMIELYKQAAAGRFSLDDSIGVVNQFYSIVDSSIFQMSIDEDSEGQLYQQIGNKLPIRQLMVPMITHSSNFATNLLINLVDARKVTQTLREMGAKDMLVLRGVEDIKAYEQGLSNRTTAYDLMLIYQQLAQGRVVSPKASEEMIDILLQQHFHDIIPALLPAAVKVAHKTGAITGVRHDSGIVFLPDGRSYVLVLLSKELENEEAGVRALAEVSERIYRYMNAID